MSSDMLRNAAWFRNIVIAVAACWLGLGVAMAAPVASENVEAELHGTHRAVSPGERFTVAVRLKMREGWHTYWRSAGDAGEPTRVSSWVLPEGFAPGEIIWPTPTAFSAGTPDFPITSYGYGGEVLLPIEIQAPPTLPAGQGELAAQVYWLECADVCIPEERTLRLQLRFGESEIDPDWAARIGAAVAAAPQRESGEARYEGDSQPLLTARLDRWASAGLRNPQFFPFDPTLLEHSELGAWSAGPDGVALQLTAQANANLGQAPLAGVLRVERQGTDGRWVEDAVEIEATPGPRLFAVGDLQVQRNGASGGAPTKGDVSWLAALGFAFLGGLILNVMPCVFPVLSVKALSFATAPASHVRRHGAFFLVGVLATFLSLAGILIALQSAGAAIGWGFQLQQPVVVSALTLVFFVLGLNLLGTFEVGAGLQGIGAGLAGRSGDVGAFFTGALAVVAASPCTAPFMGAALGFAATQPAGVSFSVFAALGLGFAFPFTALAFAPGVRGQLPKPGAWMSRFKEALAFPMFATSIYLVWVLAQQTTPAGVALLLMAALAIGLAIWLARFRPRFGAAFGLVATAVALWTLSLGPLAPTNNSNPPDPSQAGQEFYAAWSPQALAAAQAEGSPVFVNFTAAWCVTCKVNEALVLSRPSLRAAFDQAGVVALKADWTNQDAIIAAELAKHGRQGVPLYLVYAPGEAAPLVLPQQLSEAAILEALRRPGGA